MVFPLQKRQTGKTVALTASQLHVHSAKFVDRDDGDLLHFAKDVHSLFLAHSGGFQE